MVYTQIILDTRRKKDIGSYTVKLRITYGRKQKYYLLGFKMTEEEFNETMKARPAKKYQDNRIQLDHIELKAKTIISNLEAFSFKQFEDRFYENKDAGKSIYCLYEGIIQSMMTEGRISTAINYRCSMKSLQSFSPELSYIDVRPDFLRSYERFMLGNGKSISTVGIYLRPLRAVLNLAVERRLLPLDNYPFGKRRYTIPESRNIKKALDKEDLKKLLNYVPMEEGGFEDRAKDFWLFSYLCQGMNPKDILLLEKNDVGNDLITFIRQKTKGTVRTGITEIVIPILPESRAIMEKWGSSDKNSPYLFDFIKPGMTPEEIYTTVMQFVKMINKHMKNIAGKTGVKQKVTCYTARFQFTKAMIDSGQSLEYIRQCLGHKNPMTTQRYIGSFQNTIRHEIAKKYLLNFDT
jgi:integrase/recombinase XerD